MERLFVPLSPAAAAASVVSCFVTYVPALPYQLTGSGRWKADVAAVDQALQNFRVVHQKVYMYPCCWGFSCGGCCRLPLSCVLACLLACVLFSGAKGGDKRGRGV